MTRMQGSGTVKVQPCAHTPSHMSHGCARITHYSLQVIDEAQRPITKKEFELFDAPAGDDLFGHAVDFLGVELPGGCCCGFACVQLGLLGAAGLKS